MTQLERHFMYLVIRIELLLSNFSISTLVWGSMCSTSYESGDFRERRGVEAHFLERTSFHQDNR